MLQARRDLSLLVLSLPPWQATLSAAAARARGRICRSVQRGKELAEGTEGLAPSEAKFMKLSPRGFRARFKRQIWKPEFPSDLPPAFAPQPAAELSQPIGLQAAAERRSDTSRRTGGWPSANGKPWQ